MNGLYAARCDTDPFMFEITEAGHRCSTGIAKESGYTDNKKQNRQRYKRYFYSPSGHFPTTFPDSEN
jgi:hypothetical protein